MSTATDYSAATTPQEAPGLGRVTLQTVADAVGVSRMTVSNAFSKPDQLSATLRERILTTAAELGYLGPDPAARALARGSVGAVGVVLTDSVGGAFQDPVQASFFGALADALAPTGLAVSLIPARATGDHLAARDLALDGALICSCDSRMEAVEWLRRRELPLVFVDNEAPDGFARVGLDEHQGGRLAAQHLIDLGHQDIVIFTIDADVASYAWLDGELTAANQVAFERYEGAAAAMRDAGLTPQVFRTHDNLDAQVGPAAAALVADLLESPERHATAVICFSDTMAAAVVRAARARGMDVPGQLSVVGFDDTPVASSTQPALTTVKQDFVAKGRMAAQALVESIASARTDAPAPSPDRVPVSLVVRDSTAVAPN